MHWVEMRRTMSRFPISAELPYFSAQYFQYHTKYIIVYLNHLKAENDCLNYILNVYFLYLHLDLTLCISAFQSHWNYYYITFKYFQIALLILTVHAEQYFHRKCVLFPCRVQNFDPEREGNYAQFLLTSLMHFQKHFKTYILCIIIPVRFVMKSPAHL